MPDAVKPEDRPAKMSGMARWALGAALANAVPIAACSGSSPASLSPATCGPGTTRMAEKCVADAVEAGVADVATDSTSRDALAESWTDGDDHLRPDGGIDQDASSLLDGNVTDQEAGGGSPSDAIHGDAPDANTCPTQPPALNCDTSCGGSQSNCATATCGTHTYVQATPGNSVPSVIRTPSAPGMNAQCNTACASGGWVYGFAVQIGFAAGTYEVTASPPWAIVYLSHTAFCADSYAHVSNYTNPIVPDCMNVNAATDGTFYVMTKDPNAPAIDVQVLTLPYNQPGCP